MATPGSLGTLAEEVRNEMTKGAVRPVLTLIHAAFNPGV
jgi:hypothetical protein